MRPLLVVFAGGASGPWTIQRIDAVIGESLPITERLAVLEGEPRHPAEASGAGVDDSILRLEAVE